MFHKANDESNNKNDLKQIDPSLTIYIHYNRLLIFINRFLSN